MKKLLSLLVLLAGTTGTVLSQDGYCDYCELPNQSATYKKFNSRYINHRHTVTLRKNNKIIVELVDIHDYDMLQDLGTVLQNFKTAMVPLRDSLDAGPSENIRVDYVKKINGINTVRIKKYPGDESLFIDNNSDISHLKIEQDTVNILLEKFVRTEYKGRTYERTRPVQLKLVLNSLSDIDSIILQSSAIQPFLDTMEKVTLSSKNADDYYYQTTILYTPYVKPSEARFGQIFSTYKGVLAPDATSWYPLTHYPSRIGAIVDIGAGLIRNTIAPVAEAGLEYRFSRIMMIDYIPILRASANCYFLFEKKADGSYQTNDNWFVNLEYGQLGMDRQHNYNFRKTTMGAGYLFRKNGSYFNGTTIKAFLSFSLGDQFVVVPEVIATDNFKKYFPGVTFKGFLFRD